MSSTKIDQNKKSERRKRATTLTLKTSAYDPLIEFENKFNVRPESRHIHVSRTIISVTKVCVRPRGYRKRREMNGASDWPACTSRCDRPAVSMLDGRAAIGFPACSPAAGRLSDTVKLHKALSLLHPAGIHTHCTSHSARSPLVFRWLSKYLMESCNLKNSTSSSVCASQHDASSPDIGHSLSR